MADERGSVVVRERSKQAKGPGSILGWKFLLFNKKDSLYQLKNFLSVLKMATTVYETETCLAALEQVVNVARVMVLLRQCRPLCGSSALQSILIKLVATKEEAEVAKVVGKTLKYARSPAHSTFVGPPYQAYSSPRGRPGNSRAQR